MRKSALIIPVAVLSLLLSNPRQSAAQKGYFASFTAEDAEVEVEIDDINKTIRVESDDIIQNNLAREFAKKAFSKRKLEEIERAVGAINLEIYSLAEKSVSEDKTASSTVKKITKVKVPWWAWEIQNAVKKTVAMQKIWPIKSSAEEYVKLMENEEHHERFYMNSCYILAEAEAAAALLDEIRKSAGTKFMISSGDINDIESVITRTWDIESAIDVGARIKKRFENIEEYKKYDNELKIKRNEIKRLEDVLQKYSIKTEKSEKIFEKEYDVDLHLQNSDFNSGKETSSLKIIARKTEGEKNFNLNIYLQTGDFKRKQKNVTDYSFFNESDCGLFIFYSKASQTKVKVLGENVYQGNKEKWIEAVPEGKDKRVELILDLSGRALDDTFRMAAKGYIIRTRNLIDFLSGEIKKAENKSIEDKISVLSENCNAVKILLYPVHAESTARRINISVENAGDFIGLLVKAGIRKGTLQQPYIGGIEEIVRICKEDIQIQESVNLEEYINDEKKMKSLLGNARGMIIMHYALVTEKKQMESEDNWPKTMRDLLPLYAESKHEINVLDELIKKDILIYSPKNGSIYPSQHPGW